MVIEPAVEPSHTAMSFEAVMDTLRDLGAQMFVAEGDVLHYVGPRLDDGDPIRIAINQHHVLLVEAFTFSPDGRCGAEGCYRLRAEGSTACVDHL